MINDDTLYVFSSDSFQSIPLKEKSQWTKLPQGQAVSDAACVLATPNGDDTQAAMYVIGGTSQNSTYTGVQRYNFASQSWQTLYPPTSDMVDRTNHSLAYLQASNSILVYAGSRPQSEADFSSQTFLLGLTDPYSIRSFTSMAPPGNQPILLPFDADNAILMGSVPRAKEMWTFNADDGWSKYATELTDPIKANIRGLIVDGSDGSKVLTTYDMTVSPNVVSQLVLADAGGSPPATAVAPRRRDLTLGNWPVYNSSDAPTDVRSDYAVVQGANGLAVITGGSSGSPLNLFNNTNNGWVDNGLFFDGVSNGNQIPITPASVSSTSTSPTQPSATSASAAPASVPGTSSKPRMLRILGITLGVLFGLAAMFIIALLLLRYRRQKKRQKEGYINEKADRMSFQDRGAAFMSQPATSRADVARVPPNHRFTQHNTSHNSFAIVAGKLGRNASRNNLAPTGGRGSSESTRQLVKPRKADISKPMELDMWGKDKEVYQPSASGAPQIPASTIGMPENALMGDNMRSTGWSRYFAAAPNDALPSAYGRGPTVSAYTVDTEYTVSSPPPPLPSQIPSSVAVPAPLFGGNRDVERERISKVFARSPAFNNSAEDLARRGSSIEASHGQRADIMGDSRGSNRRGSLYSEGGDSTASYTTEDSDFSSEYFEQNRASTASNWTPVDNQYELKPTITSVEESPDPNLGTFNARAPSSAYSASYYGGPESRLTGGRSQLNSTVIPEAPPIPEDKLTVPGGGQERESTLTVFPKGVPSAYYADRNAAKEAEKQVGNMPKQDMSWLNLGLK